MSDLFLYKGESNPANVVLRANASSMPQIAPPGATFFTSPAQCCCYPCLVSSGDLAGVACSGTWTRNQSGHTTPNHATTNSDALWYDTTQIRENFTWKVSAKPQLEIALTGGQRYGHYELVLAGALKDCNNYVFLRYTEHRPGPSGLSYANLKLGIKIGGTEEILAEHVVNNQACYDYTNTSDVVPGYGFDNWPLSNFITTTGLLELCWDGATLGARSPFWGGTGGGVPNAVPIFISAHKLGNGTPLAYIIPDGRYAGLGTGLLSSEITRVVYKELVYTIYDAQDSQGNECGECPRHCCGSPVPVEAVVEISGVASGLSNTSSTGCYIECGDFNGTYFLSRTIVSNADINGSDCSSDSVCNWRLRVPLGNQACPDLFGDPEYPTHLDVRIQINTSSEVNDVITRTVTFLFSIAYGPPGFGGIGNQFAVSYGPTYSMTVPCDELFNWTTITVPSSAGCGPLTARFKFLP
jgi:hypothetical protein